MVNYNLTSNFSTAAVSKLALALSPVIITPILFKSLSANDVGFYYFILQVAAAFALLELGIVSSLSRLLPKIKRDHTLSLGEILSTSFWFLCLLSALGLILFFSILDLLIYGINTIPAAELNVYKAIFIVVVVLGIISLPFKIGTGHLIAQHLYGFTQRAEFYGAASRIFMFLSLYFANFATLFYLALATQIAYSTVTFYIFYKSIKLTGFSCYRPTLISKRAFTKIFTLSAASLGITLSVAILFQGSIFFTTYVYGLEATAQLSVAILIYRSITPFFQIFPTLLNPIASDRDHLKNDDFLKTFFQLGVSYTASIVGGVIIISHFFLVFILSLWLRNSDFNEFDFALIEICILLLLGGYLFSLPSAFGRSIAFGKGYHSKAVLFEVLTALLGVICLSLVAVFDLGLFGVCLAISFALFVRGIVLYPMILSVIFRLKPIAILSLCYSKLIIVVISWIPLNILTWQLYDYLQLRIEILAVTLVVNIWVLLCVFHVLRLEDFISLKLHLKRYVTKITNWYR